MNRGLAAGSLGAYALGLVAGSALLRQPPSGTQTGRDASTLPTAIPTIALGEKGEAARAEIVKFQTIGAEGFPAEFERLVAETPMRGSWVILLFERWVQIDPDGGLRYLAGRESTPWLDEFLELWADIDPARALEAAKQLRVDQPEKFKRVVAQLLWAIMETAPEHVIGHSISGEIEGPTEARALGFLAKTDPTAATEAFGKLTDTRLRVSAARELVAAWAANHPQAAIEWARSLENPRERKHAVDATIAAIATTDLTMAMALYEASKQETQAIPDSRDHSPPQLEAIENISLAMSQNGDVGAALTWFHEEFRSGTMGIYRRLAKALPQDPASLHDAISTIENDDHRRRLLKEMKFQMDSPTAAQRLAEMTDLPQDPVRDAIIGSMFSNWARHDVDATTAAFDALPESPLRQAVARQLAPSMVSRGQYDEAFAITVATGLDSFDDSGIFDNLFLSLGERMPSELGTLVESTPAGEARDRAASLLVESWVGQDPAQALEWTMRQSGSTQIAAAQRLADRWSNFEPYEASQWVARLPEGNLQQAAIDGMIDTIASQDPPAAFDWALAMQPSDERSSRLLQVVGEWRRNSQPEAMAAVDAADLPAAERTTLIEMIQRPLR